MIEVDTKSGGLYIRDCQFAPGVRDILMAGSLAHELLMRLDSWARARIEPDSTSYGSSHPRSQMD